MVTLLCSGVGKEVERRARACDGYGNGNVRVVLFGDVLHLNVMVWRSVGDHSWGCSLMWSSQPERKESARIRRLRVRKGQACFFERRC